MKVRVTLSVVCFICVAALANGKTPTLPGAKCPDFKPVPNQDLVKAAGVWYHHLWGSVGMEASQAEKDEFLARKCVKTDVQLNDTHWVEKVTWIDGKGKPQEKIVTGVKEKSNAAAAYDTVGGTYDVFVKKEFKQTITILNTDYVGDLLGTSCLTDGTKHGYVYAILARTTSVPADRLEKMKQLFKTHNVEGAWIPIDNSKC